MSICLSSILSLSNDVSDPLPVQRVVYLLSIRLNVICPSLCLCSVVLSRRSLLSHYSATSVFVTLSSSDTIRHLPIRYSRCCFSPAFRYPTNSVFSRVFPVVSLRSSFGVIMFLPSFVETSSLVQWCLYVFVRSDYPVCASYVHFSGCICMLVLDVSPSPFASALLG